MWLVPTHLVSVLKVWQDEINMHEVKILKFIIKFYKVIGNSLSMTWIAKKSAKQSLYNGLYWYSNTQAMWLCLRGLISIGKTFTFKYLKPQLILVYRDHFIKHKIPLTGSVNVNYCVRIESAQYKLCQLWNSYITWIDHMLTLSVF